MLKRNLLFIIFSIAVFGVYSQNNITFYGKTMSSKGFVYNVNVTNSTKTTGSVSDFTGDFSIQASKNDTIKFSCIGYKGFDYIIPDTINDKEFRVLILMVEDTVFIKEAIVRPWPKNTTVLRQAFLQNNKNTEKEKIAPQAGFRKIDAPQKEPTPSFMNPVSFVAYLFSKKRIQNKKMERIRRKLREG